MIVTCPHCAARYELPKRLVGPGGASVRCPRCAGEFTVSAEEAAAAASGSGAGRPRGGEGSGAPGRPREAPAPGQAVGPERGSERAPVAASGSSSTRTPAAEPTEHAELASDPHVVARRVLDELAARKGPAMADANARGRLLSEFGPELAAAFEEFRRRSGGTGNPAPFRHELRARWGIDLTPPAGAQG